MWMNFSCTSLYLCLLTRNLRCKIVNCNCVSKVVIAVRFNLLKKASIYTFSAFIGKFNWSLYRFFFFTFINLQWNLFFYVERGFLYKFFSLSLVVVLFFYINYFLSRSLYFSHEWNWIYKLCSGGMIQKGTEGERAQPIWLSHSVNELHEQSICDCE